MTDNHWQRNFSFDKQEVYKQKDDLSKMSYNKAAPKMKECVFIMRPNNIVPLKQSTFVPTEEMADLLQVGTELLLYQAIRNETYHPFLFLVDTLPKEKQKELLSCRRQAVTYLAHLFIEHLRQSNLLENYWQENKHIFCSLGEPDGSGDHG